MKGRQEQGDDGGISPPEGHLPPASPSSKAPSAPISFLSLPLENDSLEEPIAKKKKPTTGRQEETWTVQDMKVDALPAAPAEFRMERGTAA